MIMTTAQKLTEPGNLNGTNEACLKGRTSEYGSHLAGQNTGAGSSKEELHAMANDFGKLKGETSLWR